MADPVSSVSPFGMIGSIAGGVGSLLGAVNQIFTGAKNRKMASKINPMQVRYGINHLAQQNLADAQMQAGGRMAGASAFERNIFNNQANAMAGVNRNATNGAQALSLLSGLQGNTNNAFADFQTREEMNKQLMTQNVANARQGVITEGDKVYQDDVRRYQGDMAMKSQLMGAGQTNQANGFNNLANFGLMAGQGMYGNPFQPRQQFAPLQPTTQGSLLSNGLPMGNYTQGGLGSGIRF